MTQSSTRACANALQKAGELLVVNSEMDPNLEMAALHRAVFAAGGPALLFTKVKGSRFPCLSNTFGTKSRCELLFADSYRGVSDLIRLKGDPAAILRSPTTWPRIAQAAVHSMPLGVTQAPVMAQQCARSDLPAIQSWPMDGGPFVTLPQVFTLPPGETSPLKANSGMYRIQISGNHYAAGEMGLHYQLHRGIGVHHQAYIKQQRAFPVTIAVGGPPAHALAAVMPLPEGMPEAAFAGALANRRFRYTRWQDHLIPADADFVIVGDVLPHALKPEGPFGDHLGYYSLAHDFPVLKVRGIFHRSDAVWPFTVVGRPPQEDSYFGKMIHDLTTPMVRHITPGLREIHAVDEAGVHPLLLAIGSERYVPYESRRPRELLTQANAVLGFGQCSLAKYLMIVAGDDDPAVSAHNKEGFFRHLLERVDWRRDLHFQTSTTIDTLDYSGTALNEGSKVVIAAAGPRKRELGTAPPVDSAALTSPWHQLTLVMPGILAVKGARYLSQESADREKTALAECLRSLPGIESFPLAVLCDDPSEMQHGRPGAFREFLWVTFTRSNPSHDIEGIDSASVHKHWGCGSTLIIDARLKPHHAPPLEESPEVIARLKRLATTDADGLGRWLNNL